MEYLVSWEINVDAASPLEAAKEAEACQRCQITGKGARGVFRVTNAAGDAVDVDLEEEGED